MMDKDELILEKIKELREKREYLVKNMKNSQCQME